VVNCVRIISAFLACFFLAWLLHPMLRRCVSNHASGALKALPCIWFNSNGLAFFMTSKSLGGRTRKHGLPIGRSRRAVREIAHQLTPSSDASPERPHTIRIGQEKTASGFSSSTGICERQPRAACHSARRQNYTTKTFLINQSPRYERVSSEAAPGAPVHSGGFFCSGLPIRLADNLYSAHSASA
jgi:hypothetical protein